MGTANTRETLDALDQVRKRTRKELQRGWFPLVLFGLLTLLSVVALLTWGGESLAVFWAIAGIGGGTATAIYYRRRELSSGLAGPGRAHMITAAVLFVLAFAAGMIGGVSGNETVAFAGPVVVIALAYLVFARLERSLSLALVSIAILLLGVVFMVRGVETQSEAVLLTLTLGGVMLGTGLMYRLSGSGNSQ